MSKENQLHVTLRTHQEASESIKLQLEKSQMTICGFENETFYLTKEELAQYNNYHNERSIMLKLEYAKDVKYYTLTGRNINNELEKINSLENRNMYTINIPTCAIAATIKVVKIAPGHEKKAPKSF